LLQVSRRHHSTCTRSLWPVGRSRATGPPRCGFLGGLGLPRRRRSGQDEGGVILAELEHSIEASQHPRWEADNGTIRKTLWHEANKN
jgi:hypothetical protein